MLSREAIVFVVAYVRYAYFSHAFASSFYSYSRCCGSRAYCGASAAIAVKSLAHSAGASAPGVRRRKLEVELLAPLLATIEAHVGNNERVARFVVSARVRFWPAPAMRTRNLPKKQ